MGHRVMEAAGPARGRRRSKLAGAPGLALALATALAPTLALMPLATAVADAEENVRAEQRELTRVQATELVQKRYGARVVRASDTDEGGRHLYVFKLLSDAGKVWIVRVDAHSGAEVP
jgi:uncharacterized membrane protein YkoI